VNILKLFLIITTFCHNFLPTHYCIVYVIEVILKTPCDSCVFISSVEGHIVNNNRAYPNVLVP